MFFTSNSSLSTGKKAWLISETFQPTSPSGRCMSFWYFMTGNVQSTLNIRIRIPDINKDEYVWQIKDTNQASNWQQARLPIPVISHDYTVVFEGVYGAKTTNPIGGIGFDDVSFTDSSCAILPANAAPSAQPSQRPTQVTGTPTGAINCDFEKDFCGWVSDTAAQIQWSRNVGSTSSIGTGPSGDHTKSGAGGYIYMEASSKSSGDKARILSPKVTAGTYCLQ
ncbi:MAM and LDL-receptor class A domain-containing protein 1-like [Aplysia californica]|uniref:MAM and LDL-receptor class A domain-containing protein 1-like n=1 Tax=Aplysia californica TaxID=6500 RepID=A0ABM1VYX9_APLCA|nr:MAM and LDL-receptor class A domain-containing protein 1-like [Aplysia californica]